MRSRFSILVLSGLLLLSLGCNKKEQSASNPPATSDQAASSSQAAPAAPPAASTTPTQSAEAPAPAAAPAPAPEPPPPVVIPAGTSLLVRVANGITTKTAEAGQSFTGSLAHSVAVHGDVVIPSGAGVSGTIVDSKSPGKFKGEGVLAITVNSVSIHGVPYNVSTSTYSQSVKGKGKRTAVMAGGGTGAGALIGGLAGGGKGALIGGLVGAGAGTAGAAFTGNKDVEIPAETAITFRLTAPITLQQ